MIELRPYQQESVDDIRRAFTQGARRVLLVAPTGSGKSALACYIAESAMSKGNRVIFVAPRRELVRDLSRRLMAAGLLHGVLMGANSRGSHLPTLVASADTLRRRVEQGLKAPDLLVIDEAHLAVSKGYADMLARMDLRRTRTLLMTATPCRADGRGLNEIADTMVLGPSVEELITQGYLVRPVVYAPATPDTSSIATSGGDFNQGQLAEVMSAKKLTGDVVAHWKALASLRRTIVFAVNRRHAALICQDFISAGVSAVTVGADTSDMERDAAWQGVASGRIQVICSVGIISIGWDVPQVDCAILARPTLSLALHLQQVGRTLRPARGKIDALILDHAGNSLRHGLPDEDREWTLKGRPRGQRSAVNADKLPLVCPKCARVARPGALVCACGYTFSSSSKGGGKKSTPETEDGTLVRLTGKVHKYGVNPYSEDKAKAGLYEIARSRNYNPGWVAAVGLALDNARMDYFEKTGDEAPKHWTSGQINSILKRSPVQG
jgi:superfamily II DNA or RNA helicase